MSNLIPTITTQNIQATHITTDNMTVGNVVWPNTIGADGTTLNISSGTANWRIPDTTHIVAHAIFCMPSTAGVLGQAKIYNVKFGSQYFGPNTQEPYTYFTVPKNGTYRVNLDVFVCGQGNGNVILTTTRNGTVVNTLARFCAFHDCVPSANFFILTDLQMNDRISIQVNGGSSAQLGYAEGQFESDRTPGLTIEYLKIL